MSEPDVVSSSDQPRIIVDSDWKEQVAKEKAAAAKKPTPESDVPPTDVLGAEDPADESVSEKSEGVDSLDALPPPGLSFVLSLLFTQAMSYLGQFPDPSNDPPRIEKRLAKHTIDTLDELQTKTEGNRTDEETRMFREVLHTLRMAYVNCRPPQVN